MAPVRATPNICINVFLSIFPPAPQSRFELKLNDPKSFVLPLHHRGLADMPAGNYTILSNCTFDATHTGINRVTQRLLAYRGLCCKVECGAFPDLLHSIYNCSRPRVSCVTAPGFPHNFTI